MQKTKVSVLRCDSYDDAEVRKAVVRGLDLLGGLNAFVKPGENIVLKPNLLIGTAPQKGVTTHPAVFKAMGTLLKEAGVHVSYGDSPAFGKAEPNMKRSGLKQVGDELGFVLADFDAGRPVSHKDALLVKKLVIANGVLDADGLVSLPRFKTHGFLGLTGAVKNQFGCIPGTLKAQFHVKLPDVHDFAAMLVDINTFIRPRLFIMDGIMAMEGNGPRSGSLKPLHVLLISADPIALDATAARIIDLDPAIIPTCLKGELEGLGTYRAEHIEVVGDGIEPFLDPTFRVKRTLPRYAVGSRYFNFAKNLMTERPVIDRAKCTCCGTCVQMCPVEPGAVDWHSSNKSSPPIHDYNRCIRCYCCQEMCPEGAISVKTPLLGRLFSGI